MWKVHVLLGALVLLVIGVVSVVEIIATWTLERDNLTGAGVGIFFGGLGLYYWLELIGVVGSRHRDVD